MIKLDFEKIYSTDRNAENCYIGIPMPKGELYDVGKVAVRDNRKNTVPSASRATGSWEDGSIKWLFTRFEADIPANKGAEYYLDTDSSESYVFEKGITFENNIIDNGEMRLCLSTGSSSIFEYIEYKGKKYTSLINAPILKDKEGNTYGTITEGWETAESSPLCLVLKGKGHHTLGSKRKFSFELNITVFRNKSALELGYRIINDTDCDLEIDSLIMESRKEAKGRTRAAAAYSNYKTSFDINEDGGIAYKYVDAKMLLLESNEHNSEVFYGTFFGDYTDEEMGLCACVYQAQQNFPKAVKVQNTSCEIMLVPKDMGDVTVFSGMAREQKVLFYLHSSDEELQSINNKTIIYQMPDKPAVSPDVFEKAGVFPDLFVKNKNYDMEMYISAKADDHSRAYGMMYWGDSPDMGYTNQGRGKGKLVWTNNEYDFPHACALQYARTGIRRFLDYVLVTAKHWIDVDVCHYSKDPLIMGGQYEHTWDHIGAKNIVCSHEWVEGLLDYYHLSGDKDGLDTAIGIGENILRLLETPMFNRAGDANARETGWALRSLTALYIETNDEKWLEKCDWIVGHFKEWEERYGLWLSPYTDNTVIRVVFMISVAVGSLMRYYRVRPNDEIKRMILHAVDDLCDNARLDNGLFYYKELPSLKRFGNNPLILEALSIAYELTGDKKYIKYGLPTLRYVISFKPAGVNYSKRIAEGSLIQGGMGTKSFAQMMIPVTLYYKYAAELGLL